MNYIEMLKESAEKYSSIVCLGLDPVIEDIPEKDGTPGERIFKFYENILNAIVKKNIYPGAVKPNYAFYAQYGIDGITSLEKVLTIYKNAGIPVILDYKRGDIGKTAAAYAKEAFDFFKADAVTLSPYLGYDSIEPYIKGYPDKGYYILTKTSNASSGEIQDVRGHGQAFPFADQHHPSRHAAMNERDQESRPSGLRLSPYGQHSIGCPA